MTTPENLVKNFIEDYFCWYKKCFGMRTFEQIEAEYQKLIDKYCRSDVQPLGVAFGSNPRHNPDNEKIVFVETFGQKSIIKTQNVTECDFGKFISDYEFQVSYENDHWYLEKILYVDEEGKYESL